MSAETAAPTPVARRRLTSLEALEAESIHIMREAVAESARPVMLHSTGPDGSVMVHLARKAFHPSPLPFPLLDVAAGAGSEPLADGSGAHTDAAERLRRAIERSGADVAFGGDRRDARAGAAQRIFSVRSPVHGAELEHRRPGLGRTINARLAPGETLWVFPLANWTELDIWRYIRRERIAEAPPDPVDAAPERTDRLRVITCGTVGAGRRTLIGRLLDDRRQGSAGRLAALERDADGVDVAYRFFSTRARSYVIADTPGHEPSTPNVVEGAATADAAVIVTDVRNGITAQTRRHAYTLCLLGIRAVALVVNKLDITGYDSADPLRIEAEFRDVAARMGLVGVACIPISAREGDNLTARSPRTPWYAGPSLLEWLEAAAPPPPPVELPFRMPVQWVNEHGTGFRGLSGTVAGGTVRLGDRIAVLPSGRRGLVARIVTYDGDLPAAVTGQAVTLVLADGIEAGRGDMLCAAEHEPCQTADQFEADLICLGDHDLVPNRSYLLKLGSRTVPARVSRLKHKVHAETLERLAATTLTVSETGVANLWLEQPLAFDPYRVNRDTGGFILIDRTSFDTVAAGMLRFALRRADNVRWQALEVDKRAQTALKGHRPCVVWLTGLSGAGKSTIANAVESRLHAAAVHTCLLDGDNVRHGLNGDLGFTESDRVENIRRVAEVARLMVGSGLVVLVSLISPYRSERAMARRLVEEGEFFEVYVDTPLSVAEARDPKGLYRKARAGELPGFTGIDSPYEPPLDPEIRVDTTELPPDVAADRIVGLLRAAGVLDLGPRA